MWAVLFYCQPAFRALIKPSLLHQCLNNFTDLFYVTYQINATQQQRHSHLYCLNLIIKSPTWPKKYLQNSWKRSPEIAATAVFYVSLADYRWEGKLQDNKALNVSDSSSTSGSAFLNITSDNNCRIVAITKVSLHVPRHDGVTVFHSKSKHNYMFDVWSTQSPQLFQFWTFLNFWIR